MNAPTQKTSNGGAVSQKGSSDNSATASLPTPRGYRRPGYEGENWSAVYVPPFNLILISPDAPAEVRDDCIKEEHVHLSTCMSRPSSVFPTRNYLLGKKRYPDVEEFSDFVETCYMVEGLCLDEERICPERLPKGDHRIRKLAADIVNLAIRFAQSSHTSIPFQKAEKTALDALADVLASVIPHERGLVPYVIDLLSKARCPTDWTGEALRAVFYARLTCEALSQKEAIRKFDLWLDFDPHLMISQRLQMIGSLLLSPFDRLVALVPQLLLDITFGKLSLHAVAELRRSAERILADIRIFVAPLVVYDEALRFSHANTVSLSRFSDVCLAKRLLLDSSLLFANWIKRRQTLGRPAVLNLAKFILDSLPGSLEQLAEAGVANRWSCDECRMAFSPPNVLTATQFVHSMSSTDKSKCLAAVQDHSKWLAHRCLEKIIQRPVHPPEVIQTQVIAATWGGKVGCRTGFFARSRAHCGP